MRASFAGAATLERDEQAKRGVIRGAGQDALSSSRARGDIVYQLKAAGAGATRIGIGIEYSLQGPLAQFSRGGLVKEIVGRMVAEFGANLEQRLAAGSAAAPARARELDVFTVVWAWFKSLFARRESS
jgi:carbon-monoxide dehydrogenase small subunit